MIGARDSGSVRGVCVFFSIEVDADMSQALVDGDDRGDDDVIE